MVYTPNNWIIIKIKHKDKVVFKVLGGWSGGYLDGNSWRLNSGIEKVVDGGDYYDFHGYSGSIYRCYKETEGVRMNIAGVLSSLKKKSEELPKSSVTVVDVMDIKIGEE